MRVIEFIGSLMVGLFTVNVALLALNLILAYCEQTGVPWPFGGVFYIAAAAIILGREPLRKPEKGRRWTGRS